MHMMWDFISWIKKTIMVRYLSQDQAFNFRNYT